MFEFENPHTMQICLNTLLYIALRIIQQKRILVITKITVDYNIIKNFEIVSSCSFLPFQICSWCNEEDICVVVYKNEYRWIFYQYNRRSLGEQRSGKSAFVSDIEKVFLRSLLKVSSISCIAHLRQKCMRL